MQSPATPHDLASPPLPAIAVSTPADREALETLLAAHPDIVVAGWAGNLEEARVLFRVHAVRLVLLDLALSKDALTLLPCLPPAAQVILISDEGQGLVRALSVDPANHLRKPVRAAALDRALDRVRRILAA